MKSISCRASDSSFHQVEKFRVDISEIGFRVMVPV